MFTVRIKQTIEHEKVCLYQGEEYKVFSIKSTDTGYFTAIIYHKGIENWISVPLYYCEPICY